MQIFIQKDGQQLGPYSLDQVNEYLAQGTLSPTDPAWHDGLAGWVPLNQIAGVVDASSPAPPAFDPNEFAAKSSEPVKKKKKEKKKREVVVEDEIIETVEPKKSSAAEVIKKILSGCFMVFLFFCLVIVAWWGKWRYDWHSDYKYVAREVSGVYQLIEQDSGNIREIELFRNQTPNAPTYFHGDGVYRTAFGDRPVHYFCRQIPNFMGDSRFKLEIETELDGKKNIKMLFIIDPESMGGRAERFDFNRESLLGESSYEIQKK